MSYWALATCGLFGLGIACLIIPLILRTALMTRLAQRAHELHHTQQKAVPRFGGLALAAAFIGVELLVAVAWPEQRAKVHARSAVLITSLAMFALGFWDDLKPLGAKRKLLGQVAIALVACAFGIGIQKLKIPFTDQAIDLGGWGVLVTVFWLVGMTNLINLIDGVDGLAAGICLMLMILLAYVGHQSGGIELLVCGMTGALLGFLWFNFPPARIYLGDGGAYFLGFQIGLYAIVSSHKGTVFAALAAPLFVLALPILDTGLAILRRGLRGLPIFRPDRRHLHHHLLEMGLSRRKVVLYFYSLTLVFLIMGLVAVWSRGQLIPPLLGIATLILLFCAGKLRFSRQWFAVGRVVGSSIEMRQEVQYALTMMRWLALEGRRRNTVEEFWADLVFAAQKLGYSSIKLTLDDGQRVWEQADSCAPTQSAVHALHCGTLELKAPVCANGNSGSRTPQCQRSFCPCVSNSRLFEIVSELLAEGWIKGTSSFRGAGLTPLRFDTTAARRKTQQKSNGLSPGSSHTSAGSVSAALGTQP
jgi:UDP-GlcNAc:undecaprenyl-phosphate/decaprenyl-phosphate GlcNAc-1-phosphate transferase